MLIQYLRCKICEICEQIEDIWQAINDLSSSGSVPHVSFSAERNGALSDNRWNFGFGDGVQENSSPNDWGYVVPFDWELVSLSIGCRTKDTLEDTSVELTKSGVSVAGANVTIPLGGALKAYSMPASITGNAGDVLNFRTLVNGGADDVVVTAIVKLAIP